MPIEKISLVSGAVEDNRKNTRKIETEFCRIGGISLDEFPIDLVGDKSPNLAKSETQVNKQ